MALAGLQFGRYRLLHLIGSGGMGEVYLATDTGLNRQVAVKVIQAELSSYPYSQTTQEMERLFQREAKAVATLDHPAILPLFDYGEADANDLKYVYLVMPLRPEGTLHNWLRHPASPTPLSPQDINHLLQQAASALHYAHARGIIHQDVKPSNFLIRSNPAAPPRILPDILLADFGIARFTSATTTHSLQDPRGTPVYMAPEQWEHRPVPATDQYALAVMAYELLTGMPPFRGNIGQLMYAHLQTIPAPPSRHNPQISRAIDIVILRALAKRPEERYASISEFAQAFQRAASITSTTPLPPANEHRTPVSPSRSDDDLRATLAITPAEALYGTTRALMLPGGHKVQVRVPASSKDGQLLRVDRYSGQIQTDHQTTGTLQLTISIVEGETTAPLPPPIIEKGAHRIRAVSTSRLVLLIGLVLLMIATGSAGIFYFSNAAHQSTEPQSQATSTARLSTQVVNLQNNPYPPRTGNLILNDPLVDNAAGEWREENDTFGACRFSGQAFHVTMTFPGLEYCFHKSAQASDFAYQINMKIVKGKSGGIVIRGDPANQKFYYCFLSHDGSFGITVYNDKSNFPAATLTSGSSPHIRSGLNNNNVLGVVARGATIELYANLQLIATVQDTTYRSGYVGAAAYSAINAQTMEATTEVVFNHAKLWQL